MCDIVRLEAVTFDMTLSLLTRNNIFKDISRKGDVGGYTRNMILTMQ